MPGKFKEVDVKIIPISKNIMGWAWCLMILILRLGSEKEGWQVIEQLIFHRKSLSKQK